MNKKIYTRLLYATVFSMSFIFWFNNQQEKSTNSQQEQQVVPPAVVKINSVDSLTHFFDKIGYYQDDWKNGSQTIPRLTFEGIGKNWQITSQSLSVDSKKSIFFRLITPLVLIANEQVLKEREIVINAALNAKSLLAIANKYQLLADKQTQLTEKERQLLLQRVDVIPVSLAVAQAAEESGWGTSRFARQGNALFGQWDFSGNGMKPEQQREELGNYGVAKFDSPLASVEAYIFNINTHKAYNNLRQLRAEDRENEQTITGLNLALALDKYSERGEEYVEGLREMIRYNDLQVLDTVKLSKYKLTHLTNANKS